MIKNFTICVTKHLYAILEKQTYIFNITLIEESFKTKFCLLYRNEMQKEEIIQIHALFAKIKEDILREFPKKRDIFREYEEFDVFPEQKEKSKDEHKRAVFILGSEIAKIMSHR